MSGNTPIRQFLKFQAVPSTARPARRFVADTLRAQGATNDEILDIALVASELVSNIIEHGDGLELSLALSATPEAWELSVVGGRCSPGEPCAQSRKMERRPGGRKLWPWARDRAAADGRDQCRHIRGNCQCELSSATGAVMKCAER